jgi:hypothetical protein
MTQLPSKTFYIPLPEPDIDQDSFKVINSGSGDILKSIIALAISTDDTVVWYDHWEDGYEPLISSPTQPNTEVWGDGNCSNGYAFGTSCNQDSDDRLVAGQSIVIQDSVDVDDTVTTSTNRYDGRDKIVASFPIAMTRGMYPGK